MNDAYKGTFYSKAVLAEALSPALGRQHILHERDPVLRLHESLAAICARALEKTKEEKKKKKKYIVTEVVACHIRDKELYLSKNTEWTEVEKAYVDDLIGRLRDIHDYSAKDSIDKPGGLELLSRLRDCIYEYCKVKLQDRIQKLLLPLQSVGPEDVKFWNNLKRHGGGSIVAEEKETRLLMEKFKELKSGPIALGILANISDFWRTLLMKLQEQENKGVLGELRKRRPYALKRMGKVASYSASFNNMVAWAVGDYNKYEVIFHPQIHVKYSTPKTQRVLQLQKQSSASTHVGHQNPSGGGRDDGNDGAGVLIQPWRETLKEYIDDDQKRNEFIDKIEKFHRSELAPPQEMILHSEMHHAQDPCIVQGPQRIGVSKLCCYLCYHCIVILNSPQPDEIPIKGTCQIIVKGTHNKLYAKWMIPPLMSPQQVKRLEKVLDKVIQEGCKNELNRGKPTADSFAISQNTDGKDYQALIPKNHLALIPEDQQR